MLSNQVGDKFMWWSLYAKLIIVWLIIAFANFCFSLCKKCLVWAAILKKKHAVLVVKKSIVKDTCFSHIK